MPHGLCNRQIFTRMRLPGLIEVNYFTALSLFISRLRIFFLAVLQHRK